MEGGGGCSTTTANLNSMASIRIVVAGDHGTGKSTLIVAAAAEAFVVDLPPVLPPTEFPEHMFPDGLPTTVIDTSSSLEDRGELADELKRADVVVLTYACDQPSTLERLTTFWLPELRRLEVKVPVAVVACKFDLMDKQQASLEQALSPIMQQFREIETCVGCSAYNYIQIPEAFYYARRTVLYPTKPLFDHEARALKPRCVRALKRIFILCDSDRDGALNDAELNDFQIKCFNAPLQPQELASVKRVVQEKLAEGVHENGLTLAGFLFLHALFIEKDRLETTWTVLRKFGYNNDLRLDDDHQLPSIKRTPNQSVELTGEAVEFLRGGFSLFDIDGGGGSTTVKLNSTTIIRIVVAGDHGTGKSSLISTAAAAAFPENVPSVLLPTRLPEDMFLEGGPTIVIDTSSSLEDRGELDDELKRADVVVLTYACDQPSTLERLTTFWLPELRRLEVKVPVAVVACKFDLMDEKQESLEQVLSPIMQQFREIETCIGCSAYNYIQIPEAFYYARRTVLYPTTLLFDHEAQALKPRYVRALKRIFILCDHDRDGALNDAELNDFQIKCFNAPMQPQELAGVKRVVQEKVPEGVHQNGLTLAGFLFLQKLFIEKDRIETTWTILRKFGYNNDIRLDDDHLLPPIKRAPDQSVELTGEAVEFLRGVFSLFDIDGDGALNAHELDDLFSTAPESPWSEAPYVNAAEKNASGGLSQDGFLAQWALMTLLDPVLSVENLIYIGYAGDPSSAITVTERRCVDREKQHSDRNVFQCYVFGPKEAGKSSLLHSFVGRPFSEVYTPTTEERYTVNIVDEPGGAKKTLILREIPEDAIGNFLIDQNALAACDVAVFVHDSSNESSWRKATELLVEFANLGASTGYDVPCLIVAAKDDLDPYPTAIQDSTRFSQMSQDIGIAASIPISTKLGDFNNIFRRIVRAAEDPHLSFQKMGAENPRITIVELVDGNTENQFHGLLHRFLTIVSGCLCCSIGKNAWR